MTALKKYLLQVNFSNILCILLLMYPLFATVVRHWNSTLFGLIVLLGLVYFFTQRRKDNLVLHKYERVFLWLLVGNFLVFLLTSLINLPEDVKEIRFDIELRFLLVIPLYFLLLKIRTGFKCFTYGAIVSVFIAVGFCLYEIVYKAGNAFTGIYSHLYTGPNILIYAMISGYYLFAERSFKKPFAWMLAIGVILSATYSIYYTYSRVTYFGMLAVAVLAAGLFARKWWKYASIAIIFLFVVIIGLSSGNVSSRMSTAYKEFTDYMALTETDKRITASIGTSVGTRLEMWRAAPLVLRDHTLFGVGNGNYKQAMQKYIESKELNPVVAQHGHAHNVFVNVLIVKGLLGLVITCLVLFYPLYVYIKTFRKSQFSASIGISFICLIFLISMNETAPFVKANFVATFLIISLVIFQNHMQNVKRKTHG